MENICSFQRLSLFFSLLLIQVLVHAQFHPSQHYNPSIGDEIWVETFPQSNGQCVFQTLGSNSDLFVCTDEPKVHRLSIATGATLWSRDFGFGARHLFGMETSDSNAVICGMTEANNIFRFVKFDNNNTIIWDSSYVQLGLAEDKQGYFKIDSVGSILGAVTIEDSTGFYDGMLKVFKLDSYGALVWERIYDAGSNYLELAHQVTIDSYGNLIVVGEVNHGAAGSDNMILKFSGSTGTLMWDHTDGPIFKNELGDVIVTSSGNIIVVGTTEPISGGSDGLLVRAYTPNGAVLWNDPHPQLTLSGVTYKDLDITQDQLGDIYAVIGGNQKSWVTRHNETGAMDWIVETWRNLNSVFVHSDGQVILSGAHSLLGGDPGYVVSLRPDGNLLWLYGAGWGSPSQTGYRNSWTALPNGANMTIIGHSIFDALVAQFCIPGMYNCMETAVQHVVPSQSGVTHGPEFGLFDNDNYPDLILPFIGSTTNTNNLLFATGASNYSINPPTSFTLPGSNPNYDHVTPFNIDGSNAKGVIWYDRYGTTTEASIVQSNGGGGLQLHSTFDFGIDYDRLKVGDVDNVNGDDVILTHWDGTMATIHLFLNDGTGSFLPPTIVASTSTGVLSLELGDITGDGWLDIVHSGGPQLVYYPNDGSGTFLPRILVGNTTNTGIVSFGDDNMDGELDILTGHSNKIQVHYFTNGTHIADSTFVTDATAETKLVSNPFGIKHQPRFMVLRDDENPAVGTYFPHAFFFPRDSCHVYYDLVSESIGSNGYFSYDMNNDGKKDFVKIYVSWSSPFVMTLSTNLNCGALDSINTPMAVEEWNATHFPNCTPTRYNPSTRQVLLDEVSSTNDDFRLFNLQGALTFQGKFAESIPEVPSGVYFLVWTYQDRQCSSKLFID